jgi:hypothetical protein
MTTDNNRKPTLSKMMDVVATQVNGKRAQSYDVHLYVAD